jgi:hypothetical protein
MGRSNLGSIQVPEGESGPKDRVQEPLQRLQEIYAAFVTGGTSRVSWESMSNCGRRSSRSIKWKGTREKAEAAIEGSKRVQGTRSLSYLVKDLVRCDRWIRWMKVGFVRWKKHRMDTANDALIRERFLRARESGRDY